MSSPKSLAESTEFSAKLPPGNEERFSGYGVMGLPFASTALSVLIFCILNGLIFEKCQKEVK